MTPTATASFGARRGGRARGRLLAAAVASMVVGASVAADQQTGFRSSVDLIAVDVQVVDDDGNPIDLLGPEAFEVSIRGHRRRVVSAEFIRHAWVDPPTAARPGPGADAAPDLALATRAGRTIVIAVDIGSFDVGAERAPMEATRAFLGRLEADDLVGLYVYPDGAWIPPSTDRARIGVTLDRVIGERQPLRSYYNLRPWEIVEITAQWTNPNSFLTQSRRQDLAIAPETLQQFDPVLRVQTRECPNDPDCPIRIYAEGIGLATQLERQAQSSLGGLETLLNGLATVPGRKSVVLVSAGLLVSDRPEGRPDVGDLARILGQTAARANTTVYTVHVDANSTGAGSAGRRGVVSSDLGRDREMWGRWLEEFSYAAGGKRIYVPVGGGDFAFDQVLRESSGYYLLGVQPDPEDRDGKPRELRVKLNRKGLALRSRQWVIVPEDK
jgi:VWFA-related protein